MNPSLLYPLFIGALLALAILGYFLAKSKALALSQRGIKLHSHPEQYGYLSALHTLLPALGLLAILLLGYLFGFSALPLPLLWCGALILGALSLLVSLRRFNPFVRARDKIEGFIKGILILATLISVFTTFGILLSILFEALQFFRREGVAGFLFGMEWAPDSSFLAGAGREGEGASVAKFGAIPLFAGTFYITFIAILVALPVGVLSAIYLSEYAPSSLRRTLKPLLELLAGIPTVVYGFFAALTLAPFLVKCFGALGIDASFESALGAGIVMGVMIVPIIASLSDDVIGSIPQSVKNGSYALGMNQYETIRFIILPSAMPGIIAAALLGISRALGETMIVVMAASLRPNLTFNPLEDMTTVTVKIVESLVGDQEFNNSLTLSAFALGLVLFIVTLIINVISVAMIRRFHKKYKISNL